jgi:hypothetical protein
MKFLLFLLVLCSGWIHANESIYPADERMHLSSERSRLAIERQRIEQAYAEQMKICWQRFAVNDCLRKVRIQQREALSPLRERELSLNARERALHSREREDRLRDASSQPLEQRQ